MLWSDPQFWLQLGQIIVIDILLSGDNAVVIALASRNLPAEQQRMAIIGGTAGAVLLRVLFAVIIAYLMTIPYLKLVGGLLLLWIAVKLVLPEKEDDGDTKAHTALWAAMGTIVMADAVMSLDNVIGVAAAAKGSVTLLAIGLAISIPLCIFGAAIVLKLLDRYPVLITLGCALLGWVAGTVMISDAAVREITTDHAGDWDHVASFACAILVVLTGNAIARFAARHEHVTDVIEEERG